MYGRTGDKFDLLVSHRVLSRRYLQKPKSTDLDFLRSTQTKVLDVYLSSGEVQRSKARRRRIDYDDFCLRVFPLGRR